MKGGSTVIWWAVQVDGDIHNAYFLIVNTANPPAATPSKMQASKRLEILPLLENYNELAFPLLHPFPSSWRLWGTGVQQWESSSSSAWRRPWISSSVCCCCHLWARPTCRPVLVPSHYAGLCALLLASFWMTLNYLEFSSWNQVSTTGLAATHMSHGEKLQRECFPPSPLAELLWT